MYSNEELIDFVKKTSGSIIVEPNSDIFYDLGISGDDFHELIDHYALKYSVDMKNYKWYFHADDEGQSIVSFFIKPPYKLVDRIPVTPAMLTKFANNGQWDMQYPEHKLPKRRYDILINQILIGIFVLLIIGLAIYKCS